MGRVRDPPYRPAAVVRFLPEELEPRHGKRACEPLVVACGPVGDAAVTREKGSLRIAFELEPDARRLGHAAGARQMRQEPGPDPGRPPAPADEAPRPPARTIGAGFGVDPAGLAVDHRGASACRRARWTASMAWMIAFDGMQPTLTQVPPSPHPRADVAMGQIVK
jgi:hypothetical protein